MTWQPDDSEMDRPDQALAWVLYNLCRGASRIEVTRLLMQALARFGRAVRRNDATNLSQMGLTVQAALDALAGRLNSPANHWLRDLLRAQLPGGRIGHRGGNPVRGATGSFELLSQNYSAYTWLAWLAIYLRVDLFGEEASRLAGRLLRAGLIFAALIYPTPFGGRRRGPGTDPDPRQAYAVQMLLGLPRDAARNIGWRSRWSYVAQVWRERGSDVIPRLFRAHEGHALRLWHTNRGPRDDVLRLAEELWLGDAVTILWGGPGQVAVFARRDESYKAGDSTAGGNASIPVYVLTGRTTDPLRVEDGHVRTEHLMNGLHTEWIAGAQRGRIERTRVPFEFESWHFPARGKLEMDGAVSRPEPEPEPPQLREARWLEIVEERAGRPHDGSLTQCILALRDCNWAVTKGLAGDDPPAWSES